VRLIGHGCANGLTSLKKAVAIDVPLQKAQPVLSILREAGLVDASLRFNRSDKTLMIPLRQAPSDQIVSQIGYYCSVRIMTWDFAESFRPPRDIIEAVNANIPANLTGYLPRSYDVIGDIAIIDLAEAIQPFGQIVGEAIQKINPHLRLVVRKVGAVSGAYRTRQLEILAGTGSMETKHHEFACCYVLNLSTVYFNPRLSNERMRVAEQVGPEDHVVDMFAGVGPFSILIAKKHPNVRVCACDINPDAIEFLKENIFLNGLVGRVIPILGDAAKSMDHGLRAWANRIIMNLPSEAENYLPVALDILREEGTIHYYEFASRNDKIEDIEMKIRDIIEDAGRMVRSFTFADAIREVAPGRVQIAIDVLIE